MHEVERLFQLSENLGDAKHLILKSENEPYRTRRAHIPKNFRLRNQEMSIYSPPLMAKTSWIERDKRKRTTVEKYAKLRAELKAKGDYVGLSMLPRDASPTRLINRCKISGRRRAFMRRFHLSRISFRELANAGMIPGVTKSSW